MPPYSYMYICMFLGVYAYDMGMGDIYTLHIECLDDDMLEVKHLYIVLSHLHALLPKGFLDYNG